MCALHSPPELRFRSEHWIWLLGPFPSVLLKNKICVLYMLVLKKKKPTPNASRTSVFWLVFVLEIKGIRVEVLKQRPAYSSSDAFTCGWLLLCSEALCIRSERQ